MLGAGGSAMVLAHSAQTRAGGPGEDGKAGSMDRNASSSDEDGTDIAVALNQAAEIFELASPAPAPHRFRVVTRAAPESIRRRAAVAVR